MSDRPLVPYPGRTDSHTAGASVRAARSDSPGTLLCRPPLPALLPAVPSLTPSNGSTTLPRRRHLQQTISERANWTPWRDCTYLAPRCGAAPSLPFLRYDHRCGSPGLGSGRVRTRASRTAMCWIDASCRTWLGSPSGTRGVARSTVSVGGRRAGTAPAPRHARCVSCIPAPAPRPPSRSAIRVGTGRPAFQMARRRPCVGRSRLALAAALACRRGRGRRAPHTPDR
ncbi:hypothetical protein C8Q77DRAFT_1132991, partial [Trametes polyzona]